jgi:hypothetical protein
MSAPEFIVRSYGGGADVGQLSEEMGANDLTFAFAPDTGWTETWGANIGSPLGTSGPFTVVIDRFTGTVEKILCSAVNLTTGVVTVYNSGGFSGRGYDGTTAQGHVPNGSTSGVQTCWSAAEAFEANQAVFGLLGGSPANGQFLSWSSGAPLWTTGPAFPGAWTAYTATWSASGTQPAIGNGALLGYYSKIGRQVTMSINVTSGSTTTYGSGSYAFALPFAAASTRGQILPVYFNDETNGWSGTGLISTSATTVIPYTNSGGSNGDLQIFGAGQFTTTGQVLQIQGTYESST